MKHYLIILCMALSFWSCQKCKHAAQYVVPMYLSVMPAPRVVYGQDTITFTAYVPYETADLRLPGYPVNVRRFKPSELYFSLTARPFSGPLPIPPIIPFLDGYFDISVLYGKRLRSSGLLFDFEHADTAWIVSFQLIPLRKFEGLYTLRPSRIQYKDRCMQIDPSVVYLNTPQSHHLVQERLNFPLSPWHDDLFFYVE